MPYSGATGPPRGARVTPWSEQFWIVQFESAPNTWVGVPADDSLFTGDLLIRAASCDAYSQSGPATPIPLFLPVFESRGVFAWIESIDPINLSSGLPAVPLSQLEHQSARLAAWDYLNAIPTSPLRTASTRGDFRYLHFTPGKLLLALLFDWICLTVVWRCLRWFVNRKHNRRVRDHLCLRCGYPLRNLTGSTCPECGTPFGEPPNPA